MAGEDRCSDNEHSGDPEHCGQCGTKYFEDAASESCLNVCLD